MRSSAIVWTLARSAKSSGICSTSVWTQIQLGWPVHDVRRPSSFLPQFVLGAWRLDQIAKWLTRAGIARIDLPFAISCR
jgi:hypothetical protein